MEITGHVMTMVFTIGILLLFFCAAVALCVAGGVVGVIVSIIVGIREFKKRLFLLRP